MTRDRDVMSRTISKIDVSGGGACPENSMVGLLKAIDLAEKDSHIFVFTDAYAKDYHLVPAIIKMIQRKKPRVSLSSDFQPIRPIVLPDSPLLN